MEGSALAKFARGRNYIYLICVRIPSQLRVCVRERRRERGEGREGARNRGREGERGIYLVEAWSRKGMRDTKKSVTFWCCSLVLSS